MILIYNEKVINEIIIVILILIVIFIIRYLILVKQNMGLAVNIKHYAKINDIEHYLTIRGEKLDAPILITLHGGPNCSLIPFSFSWQKELEKNYIVVNYDQRLCGRTAMRNKNINILSRCFQKRIIGFSNGFVCCWIRENIEQICINRNISAMCNKGRCKIG